MTDLPETGFKTISQAVPDAVVPDTAVAGPRVVFHPEVSARHRRLLTARPEALAQARSASLSPWWRRGRERMRRHQAPLWVGLLAAMTFLVGQAMSQAITLARSRPELADLPSPDPMRDAMLALTLGMLATAVLWLLTAVRSDYAVLRAARLHRDRCITPTDLDEPAREVLCRAQAAIGIVLGSQVYAAGLVDRPRVVVTLANEEWDIAVALRAHSRLRATQRQAERASATERVGGVLRRYHHMLDVATDSVAARVHELERYAEQIQAADAAYAECPSSPGR